MPRLSVDLGACRIWGVESDLQPTIPKSDRLLDLVLPDHTLPWAAARKRIDSTLAESRKRLHAAGFQVSAAAGNDGQETRLELTRGNVLVKVALLNQRQQVRYWRCAWAAIMKCANPLHGATTKVETMLTVEIHQNEIPATFSRFCQIIDEKTWLVTAQHGRHFGLGNAHALGGSFLGQLVAVRVNIV